MKERTRKWLELVGYTLGCVVVVGLIYLVAQAAKGCDPDWDKHAAEHEVGSGAVCGVPSGHVIECMRPGHAYQCVVDYANKRIACAEVNKL